MSVSKYLKELLSVLNVDSPPFHEEVFYPSYLPDSFLCRQPELKLLVQYVSQGIQSRLSRSPPYRPIILTGPPATGKTGMVRRLLQDYSKILEEQDEGGVSFYWVNCRSYRSPLYMMNSLIRHFVPHLPMRGFSLREHIEQLQQVLILDGKCLVLVLDEVQILPETDNGIYLLELLLGILGPLVVLILVGEEVLLDHPDLSKESVGSLSDQVVTLEPYRLEERALILTERIRLSGYFGKNEIELGRDYAHLSDDLRFCLDSLRQDISW